MSTRGERIRQALEIRGVKKQQALAAELKVHESAITRWKENASMSLESAVAFGTALDVSLDWLLLGRGTIDAHKPEPLDDPAGTIPYTELARRIHPRVDPGSISLLLQAIETIVNDVSRPGES